MQNPQKYLERTGHCIMPSEIDKYVKYVQRPIGRHSSWMKAFTGQLAYSPATAAIIYNTDKYLLWMLLSLLDPTQYKTINWMSHTALQYHVHIKNFGF
jgi:hypothetical protein